MNKLKQQKLIDKYLQNFVTDVINLYKEIENLNIYFYIKNKKLYYINKKGKHIKIK